MIRRLARPLLAAVFISDGVEALRNPDARQEAIGAVVTPLTQRAQQLPSDARTWVRVVGGTQVAAGTLLAVGKVRRLSAAALLATLAPTLYTRWQVWQAGGDQPVNERLRPALQDLGVAGGLILAALDREGRPSVGWRARRAARRAADQAAVGRARAAAAGTRLTAGARQVAEHAETAPERAAGAGARAAVSGGAATTATRAAKKAARAAAEGQAATTATRAARKAARAAAKGRHLVP